MVEQYVTVYIADDGTEFDSFEGCNRYESECRAMLKQEAERMVREAFENLVTHKWNLIGSCAFIYDTTLYICKLNSAVDYEIVKKWCENCGNETDFLNEPQSYPCRYIFSVEESGIACSTDDDFLDWAKEIIAVMDAEKED